MGKIQKLSLITAWGYALLLPVCLLSIAFAYWLDSNPLMEHLLHLSALYAVLLFGVSSSLFFSLLWKTPRLSRLKWPLRFIAYSKAWLFLFSFLNIVVDPSLDNSFTYVLQFLVSISVFLFLISPIFWFLGFAGLGRHIKDNCGLRIISFAMSIVKSLISVMSFLMIIYIEGDSRIWMTLLIVSVVLYFIVTPLFYFIFNKYLKSNGDSLLNSVEAEVF